MFKNRRVQILWRQDLLVINLDIWIMLLVPEAKPWMEDMYLTYMKKLKYN